METTLAELAVLAAAAYLIYLFLEPLRRRIERALLRFMGSPKADLIDVTPVKDRNSRRK